MIAVKGYRRRPVGLNPLQSSLLADNTFPPAFFGKTFDPEQDAERLSSQAARVEGLVADGRPRSLPQISTELRKRFPGSHFPEASISARLRDLRRLGWTVERTRAHRNSGVYFYRAIKAVTA